MMITITAMAFDFGLRNIGVAYGQSLTNSARVLHPLKANNGQPNWEQINKLLSEWQPQHLVVGLPLNMDGTESEFSKRARKFGQRLHGRFGLPIAFMDERLSSFEAKQQAKQQGHNGDYKKRPIDSEAAKLILESWFHTQ